MNKKEVRWQISWATYDPTYFFHVVIKPFMLIWV